MLNKVIFQANLTRDPEMRYTPSGMEILNLSLANNRKRGDKEEVTFVDATAFGKTAEIINSYFRKGDAILIEGRLTLDQWEASDGSPRKRLKITVEGFNFAGRASGSEGGPKSPSRGGEGRSWRSNEDTPGPDSGSQAGMDYDPDEDVPF